MNDIQTNYKAKISLLKEARLQLLRLHKLLIDIERNRFETENGQVSSGQFLTLLLNEPNFQWLRKFSTLVVEIDEMLDLDDGYTENMIEKYLSQIRGLINLDSDDEQFVSKYKNSLQSDSSVAAKHGEIKQLLDEG
jgi:hypothetical protein